jgi:hypothetical protein
MHRRGFLTLAAAAVAALPGVFALENVTDASLRDVPELGCVLVERSFAKLGYDLTFEDGSTAFVPSSGDPEVDQRWMVLTVDAWKAVRARYGERAKIAEAIKAAYAPDGRFVTVARDGTIRAMRFRFGDGEWSGADVAAS